MKELFKLKSITNTHTIEKCPHLSFIALEGPPTALTLKLHYVAPSVASRFKLGEDYTLEQIFAAR